MPVYNKLVRDKIPEIIEKSGKRCIIETMDKKPTWNLWITNFMRNWLNISRTSR